MSCRAIVVLLGFALAGCGDLPRPFMGAPGATAQRLAQPPAPRLAIPAPPEALLPQAAAGALAGALAQAMLDQEVPASAGPVQPTDWRLAVSAEQRGGQVVPSYTVQNPKGETVATTEGPGVAIADWSAAAPATLKAIAAQAAPKVATLLAGIEASRRQSDPKSLYNRPAIVRVPDVTGAPGDGDEMLTRQMRDSLPKLGPVVQDSAIGADFTVQGEVRVVPIAGGLERVEIQWILSDAAGGERGRIIQLNEIPAGSLSRHWGDVAVVAASEAAGGVRDAILTQSGRR